MNSKYMIIVMLTIFVIAIAGCTSPAPTASPTASPTAVASPSTAATASPTAQATAHNATPSAAPTPAPTVTAAPTPGRVYSNNSPLGVTNIKIDWDTTQFSGLAGETASMNVINTKDNIAFDVVVYYKVTTPTSLADPGGVVINSTNTVSKEVNIGMMQGGESRGINFQIDHKKNVPATVSVTIQWRGGGSAVVFEKTLNMPDNNFGTYEF